MNQLVSVIIPVYNAKKTIEKCVNSILNSSYTNLEILLIDDGSDTETADKCDQMVLIDARIKVTHQKNSGVSSARNCGIEKAKGNFIMFVDADDFIDSDLLKSMMNIVEQKQADIVVAGHRELYNDGSFKECFCSGKIDVKFGKEILKEFFVTNNISWTVWAKLYKKSVIQNVRFKVGKRIAEDMYFNYEVLKNAKTIVEYGFPGYNYIKLEESAMASSDCIKFFDSFYLTKAVFDDIETDEFFKHQKEQFYVKNELFFFRLIYAKDKKRQVTDEIKEVRKKFIDSTQDIYIDSLRMRMELLLLKYFEPLYRLQAKFYWGGKRKKCNI